MDDKERDEEIRKQIWITAARASVRYSLKHKEEPNPQALEILKHYHIEVNT